MNLFSPAKSCGCHLHLSNFSLILLLHLCNSFLSCSTECSARSPLGGVQLKSPSSGGLRLGLSRHSRVKSLHANVKLPPWNTSVVVSAAHSCTYRLFDIAACITDVVMPWLKTQHKSLQTHDVIVAHRPRRGCSHRRVQFIVRYRHLHASSETPGQGQCTSEDITRLIVFCII